MATVTEIYSLLDELAPFGTQLDFDNAGFLVGRGEREVTRMLVTLDITRQVVEEGRELGAQLIVSHHPVIFQPVRRITDGEETGRVLLGLIEGGMAAICAHTNLDAAQSGVNDCLARALELTGVEQLHQDGVDQAGRPYGIGRVGLAHAPGMSPEEYAAFVKERLGAASVRFAPGGRPVSRVAVGGGACASMLADAAAAGCDTFVTADVKYNQFLDARDMGITLMDAGHYPTEQVVVPRLADYLKSCLPGTEVVVTRRHREVYESV